MRKDLLIKMLEMNSISGQEHDMRNLMITELKSLGFNVSVDNIGNVLAIRGKAAQYPLLNAHMDMVDISYEYKDSILWYSRNHKHDENRMNIIRDTLSTLDENDLSGYGITCNDCNLCKTCPNTHLNMLCNEYDPNENGEEIILDIAKDLGLLNNEISDIPIQCEQRYKVVEEKGILKGEGKTRVLGGDDKCGLFIALEVARTTKTLPMKILFTVEEEIGLIGIEYVMNNNIEWFNDIKYSITIDRRKGDNLLWSQCGKRSCDNDFCSRMALAGIKAGIPVKVQDGGMADIIYIRELVNAVNISAGYYEAHTENEYIKIGDVKKIINWVKYFINKN